MTALEGFRGLISLYIAIFHFSLHLSSYPVQVNLMGSLLMPFFFLMSGFSLAVTYGRRDYEGWCLPWKQPHDGKVFNSGYFYRKRFARIGPVYYLANLGKHSPLV